ncbi:MAG: metal-dependent transcriptional regulator [Armatimonadota bacterium]|jgi:DtxR family Mn-dependent transcriptional regulator
MLLSEKAQEILETLWLQREGQGPVPLSALENTPGFEELSQMGYVSAADGRAELTERGLVEAEAAIRRHRLAERLMADVLDVGDVGLHEASCRLEHMLHAGLEDKVCRLLGHPRVCPHGKPIPQGACCRRRAKPGEKLVAPLADLEAGEEGRVAYLITGDGVRMRELMAIGLVPGVGVKLMRKSPAYLFSLGESEFAVDEDMARAIYVRLQK